MHIANACKNFVYCRQTIDVGKIKKILEPQPSQEDRRTLPGSRSYLALGINRRSIFIEAYDVVVPVREFFLVPSFLLSFAWFQLCSLFPFSLPFSPPRLPFHHTPHESSCCIALYPSVSVGGSTSNSNSCFQQ